jgi:dipeptidyl aminopeptidase/acylaminoacyl peptidase
MRTAPMIAGLFGLVVAPLAASEGKRPITHEDLWSMKRLAQPALSPDGKLAVLVVTEPAYDPAAQVVDLWVVATDGRTAPRRLTAGKEPEANPNFSPDGRRIAFSSQRSGDIAPQIYVLDLGGGEAQRVTTVSTGARLPRFSPDGEQIAFVSSVFPDTHNDADNRRIADERKARKYNARVYTGFPVRNWDRWLDERELRLFVQPLSGGEAKDLLAGTTLAAAPGYGGRFTDTGEEMDYTWTPDGTGLVFAATANRDRAAFDFVHTDLYRVAIAGGEPERLTGSGAAESQDAWARPDFSHDGRMLFAQYTPRSGKVYDATRLVALTWPGLERRATIEPAKALSVGFSALSTDNRTLYFTAEDAGLERIFRARLGSSAVSRFSAGERGVYTNLIANEAGSTTLIAIYDSATEPQELVRVDTRTGVHEALTAFNRERAAALDLRAVEHFWHSNERGDRVHSMLVRPAGFDPQRKYPLFVMIHGGPHTMFRDNFFIRWNYHLIAARDYVLLLTNYRGSTGLGEAFAQSIQGDPLKGPGDDLNAAADEAIRRFPYIDAERQCAGGASYGGHLANWLQASTTRYRCLISHAGLVNLESQWGTSDTIYGREVMMGGPPWKLAAQWSAQNPIDFAANFRTPVLVTVGELDYRVPLNNTLEYWSALQRQRVESRLIVFPDENHWIQKGENSRYFYGEVRDWLGRFIGPAAAASTAP